MMAAGEIAAAIYNTNRRDKSDPVFRADQFVPKPLGDFADPDPEETEPEPEIHIEDLKAVLGVADPLPSKARLVRG